MQHLQPSTEFPDCSHFMSQWFSISNLLSTFATLPILFIIKNRVNQYTEVKKLPEWLLGRCSERHFGMAPRLLCNSKNRCSSSESCRSVFDRLPSSLLFLTRSWLHIEHLDAEVHFLAVSVPSLAAVNCKSSAMDKRLCSRSLLWRCRNGVA